MLWQWVMSKNMLNPFDSPLAQYASQTAAIGSVGAKILLATLSEAPAQDIHHFLVVALHVPVGGQSWANFGESAVRKLDRENDVELDLYNLASCVIHGDHEEEGTSA